MIAPGTRIGCARSFDTLIIAGNQPILRTEACAKDQPSGSRSSLAVSLHLDLFASFVPLLRQMMVPT